MQPTQRRRQEIMAKIAHLGDRELDLNFELADIEAEKQQLIDELNGLKYDRTND